MQITDEKAVAEALTNLHNLSLIMEGSVRLGQSISADVVRSWADRVKGRVTAVRVGLALTSPPSGSGRGGGIVLPR